MKIGKKFSKKFDNGGETRKEGEELKTRKTLATGFGQIEKRLPKQEEQEGEVPFKKPGIPSEQKAIEDFSIFIDTIKPGDTVPDNIANLISQAALSGSMSAASHASSTTRAPGATFRKTGEPVVAAGAALGATMMEALMKVLNETGWAIDKNGVVVPRDTTDFPQREPHPGIEPQPRSTIDFSQWKQHGGGMEHLEEPPKFKKRKR